jgi:hypothetical protein
MVQTVFAREFIRKFMRYLDGYRFMGEYGPDGFRILPLGTRSPILALVLDYRSLWNGVGKGRQRDDRRGLGKSQRLRVDGNLKMPSDKNQENGIEKQGERQKRP